MKGFLVVLALGLSLGFPAPSYAAPEFQTPTEVVAIIQDAAARYGANATSLIAIARCETGGTFNPAARGDGGRSWGLFQLHDAGLRPLFYRRGYSDPDNAWEAADFAAWAIANGLRSHWHC